MSEEQAQYDAREGYAARSRRVVRLEMKMKGALAERELLDCFAYARSHPLLRGIDELIDARCMEVMNEASDPRLPDRETKLAMMEIEALVTLKNRIDEIVALAQVARNEPGQTGEGAGNGGEYRHN